VSARGILAIFNDVRAGRESEFDAWFQGEHLQERRRVGLPIRAAARGNRRLVDFLQLLRGRESGRADVEAVS
jgi:hypothetical protein